MPIENTSIPTKEELTAKMKSLVEQYQTIRADKVAQLKGQKMAAPAPSTENAAPAKEQGSLQQGAKQQAAPMKSAAPIVEKEAGKPTPEAEGKNLMQAFEDLKKGGYSGKQPLGCLSKQFESGLDKSVETVSSGKDDHGGVSYGIYQMASIVKGEASHKSTVGVFVAKHYPKDFGNLMPGSAEFSAVWKKVSQREAERFAGMQHQFIQATHFDPKVKALLDSTGVDINQRSRPLQDAVWSTCVQHRKALDILITAFNSAGNDKASDKQLIEAIYKARTAFVAHLRNTEKNPGNRKAFENIIAKRYPQELKNALKGLSNAGETPAPTSEAGKDAANGETTNKGNNPTNGSTTAPNQSTPKSEAVDKEGNPTAAKDTTPSETHDAPKGDGKTLSAPVGENCPNNPDDVTLVQTLLNKQGFKIGIDGKFGDETAKAIADFQIKANLAVKDGVVDPNKSTWKALTSGGSAQDTATATHTETEAAHTPATEAAHTPATDSSQSTPSQDNPTAADGENHAISKYGAGAESTDAYDSQRDNKTINLKHSVSDTTGHNIEGGSQCNVTSIAMMLVNLADGNKNKVLKLTEDLLAKHKLTKEAGWGLPEMVATLIDKVVGGAIFVNNNFHKLYKLYPELVKGSETLYPTDKKIFLEKIGPALQKGDEVIFSGNFTGSGHICSLLGVREDGIVINDPFGCCIFKGNGGYMKNGKDNAAVKSLIKSHAAVVKRRLSLNGRFDELQKASEQGKNAPADIGRENFYTWEDIFNISFRWLQITHKA